jgi:hypothetical protein
LEILEPRATLKENNKDRLPLLEREKFHENNKDRLPSSSPKRISNMKRFAIIRNQDRTNEVQIEQGIHPDLRSPFTSERHWFTTDANHQRLKSKHQPIDSHLELISSSPLKIAKNV